MHIPLMPQQIMDDAVVSPHHAYRPGATADHVKPPGGVSTPPQQAMLSGPSLVVIAQEEYAPLCSVLPFRVTFLPCATRVCPRPNLQPSGSTEFGGASARQPQHLIVPEDEVPHVKCPPLLTRTQYSFAGRAGTSVCPSVLRPKQTNAPFRLKAERTFVEPVRTGTHSATNN